MRGGGSTLRRGICSYDNLSPNFKKNKLSDQLEGGGDEARVGAPRGGDTFYTGAGDTGKAGGSTKTGGPAGAVQ